MYTLVVVYDAPRRANGRVDIARGCDVLPAIPGIIEDHPGCGRVDVYSGGVKLFAVNREGGAFQA